MQFGYGDCQIATHFLLVSINRHKCTTSSQRVVGLFDCIYFFKKRLSCFNMRREGYEILEGLLYYSTRGFAPVFSLAKSGDCVLSTRILTNRSLGAGTIILFLYATTSSIRWFSYCRQRCVDVPNIEGRAWGETKYKLLARCQSYRGRA